MAVRSVTAKPLADVIGWNNAFIASTSELMTCELLMRVTGVGLAPMRCAAPGRALAQLDSTLLVCCRACRLKVVFTV